MREEMWCARAGCGAPGGAGVPCCYVRVLHRLLPYCPKSHRACPRLRRRRCFTAPPPKLHLCRKQGWKVEVREVSGHAKHLAASQKGAARNQSATLRCATLILWRCRNGGIPLTAQEWGSSVAALALARGVGRMRCVGRAAHRSNYDMCYLITGDVWSPVLGQGFIT